MGTRRVIVLAGLSLAAGAALADDGVRLGPAAYGDWRADAPGVRRLITPNDLPAPYATQSAANPSRGAPRPPAMLPKAPDGFAVDLFADGLKTPRVIRTAPNGDEFVAETGADRVRVFRSPGMNAPPAPSGVFAEGLEGVFGIAFFPSGPDPRWVYVATTGSVVRFPYRSGDLTTSDAPEIVVPKLPTGGAHGTRDIAFSPDDRTMFVSVGSATNDATGIRVFASRLLGPSWDVERGRADVLAFDPDGGHKRIYATGLRNCSGLTI